MALKANRDLVLCEEEPNTEEPEEEELSCSLLFVAFVLVLLEVILHQFLKRAVYMSGLKKELEYPSHRKMLFQMGGMSQEHSGTMSSVMKKGIQQSTNTPIKMPTISAAFFSFCSRHVSPSVWKVTVAWRTVNTICG
ncbi:hypothetical protein EYF80_016351 [Liparis tanakae]|uniref:Uncharacterized protein n=1 Tax=Liparis tanakae TaxID=230148 RepID=A0A4Z2I5U6_9TELE|nr:hypothetical protein EYF80_016351 [Liparis tanakae]